MILQAVFGVILVPRFSAYQYSYMYTLERGKHQTCRGFPASVSQEIIIIIDNGYT